MYKTTESRIVICDKCKGTGQIKVGNLREMHNHDIESCPYCFGDGSLVQTTIIEMSQKSTLALDQIIPRS